MPFGFQKFFLIPFLFLFSSFPCCSHALLPKEIYADRIANSQIKAIAVVKSLEEYDEEASSGTKPSIRNPARSKTYETKKAVFIVEKAIDLQLHPTENGVSLDKSIAHAGSKGIIQEGSEVIGLFHVQLIATTDDPLFFHPKEGERVFVTISSNGGVMTSYTILDNELEYALNNNVEDIEAGYGSVFIRK